MPFLFDGLENLPHALVRQGQFLRRRLLLLLDEPVQQPHRVTGNAEQDPGDAALERAAHLPEPVTHRAAHRQAHRPAELHRLDVAADHQPLLTRERKQPFADRLFAAWLTVEPHRDPLFTHRPECTTYGTPVPGSMPSMAANQGILAGHAFVERFRRRQP